MANALEVERGLYFRYGAKNIPHREKMEKGGEDAWVATSQLLVVCDGVGGWANQGIDSGLFSKQLVFDIRKLFEDKPSYDLKTLLVDAVKMNQQIGSSTAVLAKLDGDRDFIKTTNLGDSGYMLLRLTDDGVSQIFRSKEQQYSFNFPYQCGTGAELPYSAFDNEHQV